jgi:four helix bundle protein
MFLDLKHKKLDIYFVARELVKEIYLVSLKLPADEKFNMIQQIRRAALSVKLNFSEGSTRKSSIERKRYFEISRGSVVEVDAALETAVDLKYFTENDLEKAGTLLNRSFAMLSKMIEAQ